MSGHLGAAVVAGCFIAEQRPGLADDVWRGIEGELDRVIRGESVFGPRPGAATSAPEMFEPFAPEEPRQDLVQGIAEALAVNLDQTRQSGHNVIFAAIAIRAFVEQGGVACRQRVVGPFWWPAVPGMVYGVREGGHGNGTATGPDGSGAACPRPTAGR